MNTLEISELVESRLDSVNRTVDRCAARGVFSLPPLVGVRIQRERRWETVQGYLLDFRSSLIVVAQLCPEFTAKLVDRWMELERKIQDRQLKETDVLIQALAEKRAVEMLVPGELGSMLRLYKDELARRLIRFAEPNVRDWLAENLHVLLRNQDANNPPEQVIAGIMQKFLLASSICLKIRYQGKEVRQFLAIKHVPPDYALLESLKKLPVEYSGTRKAALPKPKRIITPEQRALKTQKQREKRAQARKVGAK